MVTRRHRIFGCAANFLRGRKCLFCGSLMINRTRPSYVTYRTCHRQKSLAKLRREIAILLGFYQQILAYRLAHDLGVDPKVISRIYQKLQEVRFHLYKFRHAAATR